MKRREFNVMYSYILPFLLTTLCLVQPSTSLPHHHAPLVADSLTRTTHPNVPPEKPRAPIEYFEVTRPINPPRITPCTHRVLTHDFATTYSRRPVQASYSPPSHCGTSDQYSKIVLEWSASCKGRQFDRIFGVWLDGVELLRSCTAEPTHDGIHWKVQKDVTKYHSLLMKSNQTLDIYMGNIVDETYTGVYHANVTIYYYPSEEHDHFTHDSSKLYQKGSDLILPISRDLPLKDGLWFKIENSTDIQSKEVVIPKNAYRAVLEVYVSFHEEDEFWYGNVPNDYLMANNSTDMPGNGPFREVLVSLDGELVGAIWPFTVIHTGGINPLLWRPISAIGSYDLPTYDIEITPFLGKLLDGKEHKIEFSVTNALNVWYVDANLHLWLDKNSKATKGELLKSDANPVKFSSRSDFIGSDGQFFTGARRLLISTGWVESSYGNITTTSTQKFDFKNSMVLGNDGNMQMVNQTIDIKTSISANVMSAPAFYTFDTRKRFPLFMYTNQVKQGNSSYNYQSNVTLGFDEDIHLRAGTETISSSSLRNHQKGEGNMLVKNNLVSGGLASTHQVYKYDENRGGSCYFRNVRSYNYSIVHDQVSEKCR